MTIFVPIISIIAWIVLEVMVFLNPSGTMTVTEAGNSECIYMLVSAIFAFFLPFFTSHLKTVKFFIPVFFFSLAMMILTASVAGRLYHRDFHTFGTQAILLHYILFIIKLDSLELVKQRVPVYKTITIGTLVIVSLWIVWLMMMSYAIVTRSEPRWIESTAYNLVNGLIALLMIFAAAHLWEQTRHRLYYSGARLCFDDRDVSEMLSPQECDFIRLFLYSEDNSMTCSGLYSRLKTDEPELPHCKECLDENWKATSCASYRNYKNRINDIKKYLELIQIGTIVPVSENPRDIKTEGWKLRLFDDVRFRS